MIYSKKTTRAFTLIELLTVIAIIGILAAILIPTLGRVKQNAHKTDDVAKIRSMTQAVLLYHSSNGNLPGRLFRAARIPSSVEDGHRERWFSTHMIDAGYLPDDDAFWSPVTDYGIEGSGHGYLLNNTSASDPRNFFGFRATDSADNIESRSMLHLKKNVESSTKIDTPATLWMITNIDSENYNSANTGGASHSISGEALTPWGGRNFSFFDGSTRFIPTGSYPSHN